MLGQTVAPSAGLVLPEGGVDTPETLRIVRGMNRRLHAAGCRGGWMIVSGSTVVGLCSYKHPPQNGEVEIGYGVAAGHRRRGYATRAVALLLAHARADPAVRRVLAKTASTNLASQGALERNGFVRHAAEHDPDEGALIVWRRDLR